MRFEWDDDKNRRNLLKHAVRFETAVLVFDDPCMLAERDPSTDGEERWNTMGSIAPGIVLFVVHTWFELNGEEVIRIISARRAESRERRRYEEAHQRAKTRYLGHRRKKG